MIGFRCGRHRRAGCLPAGAGAGFGPEHPWFLGLGPEAPFQGSQSSHCSQPLIQARPRAAQGSEPTPPELQVCGPPGAARIRWHGKLGGRGEQVIAQGPGKLWGQVQGAGGNLGPGLILLLFRALVWTLADLSPFPPGLSLPQAQAPPGLKSSQCQNVTAVCRFSRGQAVCRRTGIGGQASQPL